jgi:hypothetical protein
MIFFVDLFVFSFTIQRVHGESHQAWCYHFYVVFKEYEEKDMFIPPLNLLLFPISCLMRRSNSNFWIKIFFEIFQIDLSNHINNQIVAKNNNRDKEQLQRIAEKYWKEKQNRPSKSSFSNS